MKLWTPRNVVAAVFYAFHRPAPVEYRCWMGAPVHPRLHCPRWANGVSALWCDVHYRNREAI